jgi:hypothetical protein
VGIISEKVDMNEKPLLEKEIEDIQNGKYYMGDYSIHWSLNLSSKTIILTLNPIHVSQLGKTKIISRKKSEAEFRVDTPWNKTLYAKISGNFNAKKLLLNGSVITRHVRGGWTTKKYENVIITSW